MNDSDVSRQIQQMVRFIRQEAEEKANEISVSAEEVKNIFDFIDTLIYNFFRWVRVKSSFYKLNFVILQEFNIEKLQLVEAEKKKIRQEYERKQKQVEIRKKM